MAILFTPGQIVAPPDWQSMYEQHGGIASSVMVPITDPKVQSMIAANPDLAATLQQHPIYRYYMRDGSYMEAFGQENGEDVQIVDYKPSSQFTQQQGRSDPNDPDARNKAELQRQREKNAALPPDQDPAYETDEERRKRAETRIKEQGEAARRNQPTSKQGAVPGYPGWTQVTQADANGNEITVYTDPQGQTFRSLPAKPESQNGTSVKGADGRTYWVTPGQNGGQAQR